MVHHAKDLHFLVFVFLRRRRRLLHDGSVLGPTVIGFQGGVSKRHHVFFERENIDLRFRYLRVPKGDRCNAILCGLGEGDDTARQLRHRGAEGQKFMLFPFGILFLQRIGDPFAVRRRIIGKNLVKLRGQVHQAHLLLF